MQEKIKNKQTIKEYLYYVQGMHCASCEVLIEKKILEISGIQSVEASAGRGQVLIEYEGEKPSSEKFNKIFKKENYVFFDKLIEEKKYNFSESLLIFNIVIWLIAGFLLFNKLGLSGLINVSSKSSLPAFFMLGVLAGVSTCAALVGGLILSMSKQWQELYANRPSFFIKLQPHLIFNIGRIASYTIFGAILGMIGSRLQISLRFTSFLVISVSIVMILLALQMLGVKKLRKFQFTLPKSITKYIADETNFKGKYMPFLLGASTFFLPCGFTITAQGMALLSGNPLQGGLIMLSFALGTAPMLFAIGLSAVKFFSRPHLSHRFSMVAGILVLFFAIFNINNQLNVLGYTSANDFLSRQTQTKTATTEDGLPAIVNGKQIIKMDASSSGYKPNYFKVKVGVPVRWEITDRGTSGCTNAVISRGLFDGQISLTPDQVSVKEFTPTKPGKYKFSCWMGMISGIIEVVDGQGSAADASNTSADNNVAVPSGAKGCGGGGGGCGGSCGGGGGCACGGSNNN